MIHEEIARVVREEVTETPGFDSKVSDVHNKKEDPYTVVDSVMQSVIK